VPLQYTIFLGAGLSMALYIYASSRHVHLFQLVATDDGHWEEQNPPAAYPSQQITVLRFDHLDFFAEVPLLEDLLPSRQGVRQAAVILTLRYMESLPSTTLKWLAHYSREMRKDGNLLLLAGVGRHVSDLLSHTGIIDTIGKENIFPARRVLLASINDAVARAQEWIDQNNGDPGNPKH
ncbi:MAG: STAS domain-containing protein, partial [Desulfobacterales bacterium]